jgi:ATP-dependent DNA helicase DinG
VIQFKQGFGRLIRSEDDRGVFVMLDGRVKSKGYGSMFMHSLPPMPETSNVGAITRFLEGEEDDEAVY